MKVINGYYFHVVTVKNISVSAQSFNSQNIPDEFWENFDKVPYFSPVAYASCINNPEVFTKILRLFKNLDDNHLKYSSQNSPSDFVKRHILCDGVSSVILCNKYLLKKMNPNKSGDPQVFYTRKAWLRATLKILYPTTKGIPTDTPSWALMLIHEVSK